MMTQTPQTPGNASPAVLVVDDEPELCALLAEYLARHGFQVRTAPNAAAARALVAEQVPAPAEDGASFRLSLPISGKSETVTDTTPAPLPEPPASPQRRALVVDDEPELAKLMRYLLENEGFDVATAESGAVALEMLDMRRFDAIVSDLRMPDMDGAGLWRAVSAQHPRLARAMLFVTGDTLSPDARAFLQNSQSDWLDKPFTRDDLLAKVAALMDQT
nr:response regulator [uncultured Albidiferax sp.]